MGGIVFFNEMKLLNRNIWKFHFFVVYLQQENFNNMKTCEKERAIACLKLAIELAGDGGMTPFTDKEYDLMYKFIEELENDNE